MIYQAYGLDKKTPAYAVSHKDINCVQVFSVCRTDSFDCPSYSVLCGSRDFFGCELSDIAKVDVDLLRCGFAVLCRSFVDNDSFYECAKHFGSQLP